MGGSMPKQYIGLKGTPILARTAQAFETHPKIDGIIVTVPKGQEAYCKPRSWKKRA